MSDLTSADEEGLELAAAALRAGEVVLVPTDTTYGLAALARDQQAVAQLFVLKRRPAERSIAVLVADLGQAHELARLGPVEQSIAAALWPGPLTLVLERRADVDPALGRADGTIALRWPGDDFVCALAARVGPLATTSANISGEPTPSTAAESAAPLDGEVAVIVDDGPRAAPASTVARALASGDVVVLREGSLSRDTIMTAASPKDFHGK